MATYEKALNQMIIDEDIKGVITATEGFGIGECDISSSYFKPVEIITEDNCRFKTADKIGYDITDITHPIFFLSDDYKTTYLETESTGLRALAKDTDNKEVFGGVGNIQDGIVRINDKGAATGDDAIILNKTYAYMGNEKDNNIKWSFNGQNSDTAYSNYELPNCGEQITSVCKKVTNQKEMYYNEEHPEAGSLSISDIEVYSSNGSLIYKATGCTSQDEVRCQSVSVNLEDSAGKSILESCLLEDGLAHGTFCCPDGSMNFNKPNGQCE